MLDLFCGIGGLTLGLEKAGFRSIGGIDHWEDALRTYSANLGLPTMAADLTAVGLSDVERHFGISADEIDVIAGGPPCQGFSTVGKRDAKDPRNLLWTRFFDLVAEVEPSYILIENVSGLAVSAGGRTRRAIEDAFRELGYGIKSKILLASDFGVPQLRKRLIFLGWRTGRTEPSFPRPSAGLPVTVAEAIYDLPELASGETKSAYRTGPQCDYQAERRGEQQHVENHTAANHPASLVEILSHIPDGGNRLSIPDHLQPKSGFHNSYARLNSYKPAVAITSNMRKPSSARATHPRQNRGLTVREGLRLQSFDDVFSPLGSRTSQYLQVGNAVPPLLAEAIGIEVRQAFEASTASPIKPDAAVPGKRQLLNVSEISQRIV